MANFQAYNDKVWTLTINLTNPNTQAVTSLPGGTVVTATSGLPNSLGATIVGNGNQVRLTPKVVASPAIPVTLSATGYASQTLLVDVVADPNPVLALTVDQTPADAQTSLQSVPAAPGP